METSHKQKNISFREPTNSCEPLFKFYKTEKIVFKIHIFRYSRVIFVPNFRTRNAIDLAMNFLHTRTHIWILPFIYIIDYVQRTDCYSPNRT